MDKTIAVIDGNSLMHRAYHAVPPAMTAPDGTPTNAAFGFMQMLIKFIETEHPDALICAFDKGRPAFRIEALEQYKAQRPHMDDALRVQFPVIQRILGALDIPVVMLEGWEGDDILGTIAARDEKLGIRTLLVTGDKDAYQLASDLTRIVTTKKGITDVVVYGPAEVEERYGVRPDQFRDFLGLKGDSSDNIPGVPGIGDKRAASMLQTYGNLEGIYENLDKFKGKQLENLRDNEDSAFLSRQVATIVTDVPLEDEIDLEAIHFPSFDPVLVTQVFEELRFKSQLAKVLGFAQEGGLSSGAQASTITYDMVEPLYYDDEAYEAIHALIGKEEIALSWSLADQANLFEPGLSLAVALPEKGSALLSGEQAQTILTELLRDGSFTAIDIKHLIEQVYPASSADKACISDQEVLDATFFDISLAAYVANSNESNYDLNTLASAYLGTVAPELDDKALQHAQEAYLVKQLAQEVRASLTEHTSDQVYDDIDAPLVSVLCMMERTGAALDREHLAELSADADAELGVLRDQIYAYAGEEFNIDSPKQLAHILFEVLGLTPIKKTRRGYSTDATVLKELAKTHELPALIMSYREFAKIKSTYIDSLPKMANTSDGRIHTSYNQMVTTTGRLSSSDPNLQNIPVRTDFGRKIRECFIPLHEDELFVSADYSQIELRLLAHLSGDEHLIDAFNSGADFHARTASRVFGIPLDEVTPLLRSRAKAVNFGIVYGQQAFGLSQSLDIPFADAKEMIDRYFEAYPGVRQYLDATVAKAHEKGYVETLFGRRRYIPELSASNAAQRGFGERTAMNHPMQGSAADIIKIAMRRVQAELVARGLKSSLMLQVHDELDLSVPHAELDEVTAIVKEIMESVIDLSVPLLVDVSPGQNWAQAH